MPPPWNFGLAKTQLDQLEKHFKVVEKDDELANSPWNPAGVPIRIHTVGRRIDDWELANQIAALLL